ncbi:MAG: hypothetical protein KGJ57_18400 [Sphingomonadales bacterium]|nr:hypothetical protein [Sphingomonadales bacterium]MDE2171371.1 hypothetical protein [Sphingomonadales bacterium]
MSTSSHPALKTFVVEVSFFSGGQRYAGECYTIDAGNWYQAETAALQMSVESPYDDPRVPDLRREAIAREC